MARRGGLALSQSATNAVLRSMALNKLGRGFVEDTSSHVTSSQTGQRHACHKRARALHSVKTSARDSRATDASLLATKRLTITPQPK
jgi:hypothetical protein